MRLKAIVLSTILSLFFLIGHSQSDKSYEVGVNLGVASFQTDYGQRGDLSTLTGNIGFAFGAAAYLNFFDRDVRWNSEVDWVGQHLKVKAEISYLKAELEHHLDESSPETLAMHGSSSIVNVGGVLEYHFLDLTRFSANNGENKFSPFVGIGAMINFSNPTFETSLALPDKYIDHIFDEKETVLSVLISVGTRVSVGYNSAIVIDSRWQYFTSDKIDALDSNHFSDKHNDWMYFLSVGYVFFIN